jgi:hypothetical protein
VVGINVEFKLERLELVIDRRSFGVKYTSLFVLADDDNDDDGPNGFNGIDDDDRLCS